MLKSGCYNLSADRIVAPYVLHSYMKRHDSDDSPVAAKLQRLGSFRRKALYKYGFIIFIINIIIITGNHNTVNIWRSLRRF